MAMVIMSSTDKNGKVTSHVQTTGDNDLSRSTIVCGNNNHVSNGVQQSKYCRFCKAEITGNTHLTIGGIGKNIKYVCESCAEKKGLV